MRCLVSGGAGFIASHIVDALIANGHKVLVIDDLSTGRRENLNPGAAFRYARVEALDLYAHAEIEKFAPTHICHQAAQASLLRSHSETETDAEINIVGTCNMIQLARQFGARLVFASTSAVYKDGSPLFHEGSTCQPNRPYGLSKYTAERYIEMCLTNYAILRYGNVYGPRQIPVGDNQIVPRALDGIVGGKPFQIYGSGENKRDYVYVGDVAKANVIALASKQVGVFNISTGHTTSVNLILESLKDITGIKCQFEHVAGKPGEPESVCLSPAKAYRELNWSAHVGIVEGLDMTVKWYKATHESQSHHA